MNQKAYLDGYIMKEAGSDLLVLAGKLNSDKELMDYYRDLEKNPDSPSFQEYPADQGYHYAAQGKYAGPFAFRARPKYLQATEVSDGLDYVPPESMEDFLKDYDEDALENYRGFREEWAGGGASEAELAENEAAFTAEHERLKDWLRKNFKDGITIGAI